MTEKEREDTRAEIADKMLAEILEEDDSEVRYGRVREYEIFIAAITRPSNHQSRGVTK